MSGGPTGPIIDVDRLVSELQERVAARTAAGDYDEALLGTPFSLLTDTPIGTIVLRPEAAYSSKPVVGPIVTRIKRALISALFHFLNDAVSQANVALAASRRALDAESNARETLEAQIAGTQKDLADALARIDHLERDLAKQRSETEELALNEMEARLIRLERSARPGAPTDATPIGPVDPNLVALAARVAEPADADERYDAYVAQIGGGPILDLSPGDGRFIARCEAAGIEGAGVDDHTDDALAHLARREPGSLHGIAAIGLCDRLGPSGVAALADLAATRLTPGGTLVVEIANPLTLAGRARRLRDPTLSVPVHPDTLAWTLRLAGLDVTETRYLGAFPGDESLPLEDPPVDELGVRYNTIAHRLNRMLVGEPLIAIFARRPPAA